MTPGQPIRILAKRYRLSMTAKQRLIKLIDEHEISEAIADEIEALVLKGEPQDPMLAMLENAPPSEATTDEIEALEEADADDAAGGRTFTLDEIKRELGLQ